MTAEREVIERWTRFFLFFFLFFLSGFERCTSIVYHPTDLIAFLRGGNIARMCAHPRSFILVLCNIEPGVTHESNPWQLIVLIHEDGSRATPPPIPGIWTPGSQDTWRSQSPTAATGEAHPMEPRPVGKTVHRHRKLKLPAIPGTPATKDDCDLERALAPIQHRRPHPRRRPPPNDDHDDPGIDMPDA